MTKKEVEGDEEEGAHWTVKERLSVLCKSPVTYWMCSFVLIYKLGELKNNSQGVHYPDSCLFTVRFQRRSIVNF